MSKDNRKNILEAVRNPLIFFALALLIIEGIIGIVATKSGMSPTQQFYTVIIMAVLFLCVVGSVVVITIRWPRHLTYQYISESLDNVKKLQKFIDSKGFADVVRDITCGTCTNFTVKKIGEV